VEPSPPFVRLQALRKKFGADSLVIDGIDLTVAPGEFVAVIGPSGCGKSTLLKMIAGLSPVSSGQLSIAGQSPDALDSELAYVFQEPTLLPWLNVSANVELPLRLRGIPAESRAKTVTRCLAQVRLREKATAFPRQLSGGQQMRVSLARALSLSPRLLLLDEPFGALDEMTRNHLNEELLRLREEAGWTAFFVTHSVAEAVFLANRIVIMSANPGRIAHLVEIEIPYPRRPETREDPSFQQRVAHVTQLLRSVESKAA